MKIQIQIHSVAHSLKNMNKKKSVALLCRIKVSVIF